jgi:NADPH:quinone reductase-like Zn-dependent oxidoreductase
MMQGAFPVPWIRDIVAGSDGAGEVVEVGDRVTDFKKGDRVATTFYQDHASGPLTARSATSILGALKDGTFRQYAVFPQQGLVHVPKSLTWQEASTLGCAAVTAWNALYGDRKVVSGDTILVQGTGGVSLFALQVSLSDHPGMSVSRVITNNGGALSSLLKLLAQLLLLQHHRMTR